MNMQTKILCIEDDRATAALIASKFTTRGYAAALAHDHSEVQELWMRVEDLCVPGGVIAVPLAPLD